MARQHQYFVLWANLYLGWIVILVWLSLTSGPSPWNLGFALEDKLNHAAAYAVLAFLGERVWSQVPWVRRAWATSLAVALLMGALMELAQAAFTHVRVAEWGDWIADGLGAGLGLFIAHFYARIKRPVNR